MAKHDPFKFTHKGIEALKPEDAEYSVGDTSCEGRRIRVTPKGVKTFVYVYRSPVHKKPRAITVGQFPDVSLDASGTAVDQYRAIVKAKRDPKDELTDTRVAKKNESETTFAVIVEKFIAAKLVGTRAKGHRAQLLERVGRCFGWNGKPFASITEAETVEHLETLRDAGCVDPGGNVRADGRIAERREGVGGKVAAFAAMSILRELWKWSKRRGFVTTNFFAGLEVDGVTKPARRTRSLTTAEIRIIWRALDTPERYGMSRDAATALRLILITAARPGMVCKMLSKHVHDLDSKQIDISHLRLVVGGEDESGDHDGPVWILPHEFMKRFDKLYPNKEPFIVPLNAMAVRLIKGASGGRDHAVLGTPTLTGRAAMTTNKLAKCVRALIAKLRAEGVEMERWTPHDLRRTAASLLSAAKITGRGNLRDEEIGWLMAHKAGHKAATSTTGIYTAGNERFDEKRFMAIVLGREVETVLRDERIGLDRARYKRAA